MERFCLTRLMSKTSCTPDNAAYEGSFGRLKNEMYYSRTWSGVSMREFIDLVDQYPTWHNQTCIRFSLGGLCPHPRSTSGSARGARRFSSKAIGSSETASASPGADAARADGHGTRRRYPFTAPTMIPFMKKRCTNG